MTTPLDTALTYAARGWPVFPCKPGTKVPDTTHGVLDATTDQAQIRAWWKTNPRRNVAIATGAPGPDVVDVDVKNGNGYAGFNQLAQAGLTTGVILYVKTPSGGLHAYYTGTTQRNSTLRNHHIDFRGKGGYVLAPPSTADGRPYTTVTEPAGPHGPIDWQTLRVYLDPPPDPEPFQQPGRETLLAAGDTRPGDDFAARTTWDQILTPHGWRKVRDLGNGRACWCRPGKTGPFTSATTREDGGLYVFSTSTPFSPEVPYTKFGAYTVLEHGGSHTLAARALRDAGYGTPAPLPRPAAIPPAAAMAAPAVEPPETLLARLLHGGTILDVPAVPDAVWGDGPEILWAAGQSLIIAGPDGVGKTTLAGNLIKARLGLGTGEVLGLPVKPGDRNILILLMDRPYQAMAALARLFTEDDRGLLDARLRIWRGPPPQDLARNTAMLAELCALAGADTCLVDSLKDAALKLTDDEAGSGWNRARQIAIEAGTQLAELHHPRKGQDGNRKPSKLDDLYGSRWISAGAGSVVSLWGQAGDPIVELTHIKPPVETIGPWQVEIHSGTGRMSRCHGIDLVEQIRLRGAEGITAKVAATLLNGGAEPTRADVAKAQRVLERKAGDGLLTRHANGTGRGHEATWHLATAVTFPESHATSHEEHTPTSESHAAMEEPIKSRPPAQPTPVGGGPGRDFRPPGPTGEPAS